MASLKHYLNSVIGEAMAEATQSESCNANVITSSKPGFGDYQANGIMSEAKRNGMKPRDLAERVIISLGQSLPSLIDRLEIGGPGFINIFLSDREIRTRATLAIQEPDLLIPPAEDPIRVAVDYSSPNLAKEMHVGHLRGTIIGDAIVRVLERRGHTVIRQNHVGDWGTQFGMLITYMKEAVGADNDLPNALADLESFYRDAKQRFDDDPVFAENARLSVVKLQGGDEDYLNAWEMFIDESLRHCEAVYEALDVTLTRNDLDAESRYNDDLSVIIDDLEKTGLLAESKGAKCVFLPEFTGKDGEPLPLIVQKSDGGYLYSTTDLAAIRLRRKMSIQRALYVVDARQSLHFQQVFAVARAAGFSNQDLSLEHVSYGTMMGKDGRPFKTRSGDTVKLAALLEEAEQRAYDLVTEKNPTLPDSQRREIAERVGIGAVKYADLSKNRTSDYIFDWSTMLSFEGNTAPYLLYAYARIKSILKKASEGNYDAIQNFSEPEERALCLKMLQLGEIIEAVERDCMPNQLCNYLYELSGLFMKFYENCPILKAEGSQAESRLALCRLTAETLQQGLELLGITPLEQM
ncbi:MAG: arginine--tRNA ligase [Pseudomonadota bacterium]|nr:arginine--tRNA ligase [Pseudomonadota bacterium]